MNISWDAELTEDQRQRLETVMGGAVAELTEDQRQRLETMLEGAVAHLQRAQADQDEEALPTAFYEAANTNLRMGLVYLFGQRAITGTTNASAEEQGQLWVELLDALCSSAWLAGYWTHEQEVSDG